MSTSLVERAAQGVTDVFLASHGWQGDIPAAIRQYDDWFAATLARTDDLDRLRAAVPGFSALVIGVHWPSLPWGEEDVASGLLGDEPAGGDGVADEVAAEDALDDATLVERYAARLGDTPEVRAALQRILAAGEDPEVQEALPQGRVPAGLAAAYDELRTAVAVPLDGPVAAPGDDQAALDVDAVVQGWSDQPGGGLLLGGGPLGALKSLVLGPVRQLSFWRMKRRGRLVGQSGVHDLLRRLQEAAPDARVHLMGHSFGCVVVSGAIAGPDGQGLPRPVDAVLLVQGAMSLWSYAARVPFAPFSPGYFRGLLDAPARIRGPLVTTRSRFDTAVGRFYPLGAALGDDLLLDDELPRFGGIGTFGIQAADAVDRKVAAADAGYGFAPGSVYNIEASDVINGGGGPAGAHNDIAHPEIAHLWWEAVLASRA
jgi:hypothetical protein